MSYNENEKKIIGDYNTSKEKEILRQEQEYYDEERMEEKKKYLENVLEFAEKVNKEYAEFLKYKLRTTKLNTNTGRGMEWQRAKYLISNEEEDFLKRSHYTYGIDKETIEILINNVEKVLEYAKQLNPEYFEVLKSDLLYYDLNREYNKWYYINANAIGIGALLDNIDLERHKRLLLETVTPDSNYKFTSL